jgi:hypothetical protein
MRNQADLLRASGSIDPELMCLPAPELTSHLRSAAAYSVRRIQSQRLDNIDITEYHISGATVRGEEVWISLRIAISAPADRTLALTIPGGRGAVREQTLIWLAGKFGNHAALDWIGRGRSPVHSNIGCRYDPLFLESEELHDSFTFNNLAAIWAAFNWLHHIGYAVTPVLGGSWGGVFALLLGALDRRVSHIYSTFGCGGFCIPGIEKRNMWDAAIQYMGPRKSRQWFQTFDPILRLDNIEAEIYLETATNDKFFSLEMAMETWARVRNKMFLALAHNQDHTMRPLGSQPYRLVKADSATIGLGRQFSQFGPSRESMAAVRTCEQIVSIQATGRSHVSRAWQAIPVSQTNEPPPALSHAPSGTTVLYYLCSLFDTASGSFRAATPIFRAEGYGRPRSDPQHCLITARQDLWSAPVGDRISPSVAQVGGCYVVQFDGERWARFSRFGVQPWTIPRDWREIRVVLAEPLRPELTSLLLFVARDYQLFREQALGCRIADCRISTDDNKWCYICDRMVMRAIVIMEPRFGDSQNPPDRDLATEFDTIGLIDTRGKCTGELHLISIDIA